MHKRTHRTVVQVITVNNSSRLRSSEGQIKQYIKIKVNSMFNNILILRSHQGKIKQYINVEYETII